MSLYLFCRFKKMMKWLNKMNKVLKIQSLISKLFEFQSMRSKHSLNNNLQSSKKNTNASTMISSTTELDNGLSYSSLKTWTWNQRNPTHPKLQSFKIVDPITLPLISTSTSPSTISKLLKKSKYQTEIKT